MEAHIGEEFDGVISGMTSWGIYVELPNTIEGMVSVSALKDGHYTFDENHYEMVNNVTNNTYVLGQKVRVKVVNTDRVLRTIDFEFISKEATSHGKTNRRKKADSQ
jgi:ribonuclease R